jgi:hypothetical protein
VIPIYSRVLACTDRLDPDGVQRGQRGYVVEDYGDGDYEVEFSRPDGTTIWLGAMSEAELEIDPE